MPPNDETGPSFEEPAPSSSAPTDTPNISRPYGMAAFKYRTLGWRGPLPAGTASKPLGKDPRESGWTGWKHADVWPDDDQLAEWVRTRGHYNIALRLPRDVVGLDVDAWKGDTAVETMAAITQRHGKLPRTWLTTSRDDGRSGIRLFRLPVALTEATKLKGTLNHPTGDDRSAGEVIQHGHRVAVVWPSVHPKTGATYRWIEQGTGETGTIPKPADLPTLPAEWVDHLREECSCFVLLTFRMAGPKDPVADAFSKWHNKLTSGTYSRHDAALGGSLVLVSFKNRGWPGAGEALQELEADFMSESTTGKDARTPKEAADEWRRMIDGAEAKWHTTTIPPYEPPRGKKPKETTRPEGRRIQLTPASSITMLPVRWVWEDRVPVGEICMTPGLAGIGKSAYHSWIAAHLTKVTLPGVHYGTPKPVIICAHEDSWERSIAPRLVAAGADLDLVFRAEVPGSRVDAVGRREPRT